MARIKLGAIVTEVSGSLGGNTYQNSRGGCQLRVKPIPLRRPSESQLRIRTIIKRLQEGWRAATEETRALWRATTIKGLSGHALWMKLQFTRLYEYLPFLSDPNQYLETYLGSELIVNGEFNGSTGWTYNAYYSFPGDHLLYTDGGVGILYQNFNLTAGLSYQLRMSVQSLVSSSIIFLSGTDSSQIWPAPYNAYHNYKSGQFILNLECQVSTTRMTVYASSSSDNFKMFYISLKQILQ